MTARQPERIQTMRTRAKVFLEFLCPKSDISAGKDSQTLCGKGTVLMLTYRIMGNEVWPLGHGPPLEYCRDFCAGFPKSFTRNENERGKWPLCSWRADSWFSFPSLPKALKFHTEHFPQSVLLVPGKLRPFRTTAENCTVRTVCVSLCIRHRALYDARTQDAVPSSRHAEQTKRLAEKSAESLAGTRTHRKLPESHVLGFRD